MQLKNYNVYFFFLLLAGISILVYFILKPFLVPFLIAVILAHLFGFLYRYLLRLTNGREVLSSILACLGISLLIVVPIIIVLGLVVNEIQNIIVYFSQDENNPKSIVNSAVDYLSTFQIFKTVDFGKIINPDSVIGAAKSLSQNALFLLQSTYKGVTHFIFVSFVTFFSLFFLFIDGDRMIKKIMQLSPLRDKYEKILIEKFNSITRGTIKGTSLIAVIQGLMGSILFLAAGVPSPILLGMLMMIASVIPAVGSGLIWVPVGIIMLITGNIVQGIVILAVGGLIISSVDNVLRPKLVGKDTQMHPLMILFSTLGGIALFGISGFIVGPIIVSLFLSLWDIYSLEFKSELAEFNK